MTHFEMKCNVVNFDVQGDIDYELLNLACRKINLKFYACCFYTHF